MTESAINSCWVITEGIAGTENQCLGVAEALGLTPTVKRVKLRTPWKQLSPWLNWGHQYALAAGSDPIAAPWPDLVIASGRKSIGIARYIKRASGGKTFVVQVQDPHVNPKHFDLVIVPAHDPMRGENVIVTTGGLHRVTPQKLAAAGEQFKDAFSNLPPHRIAVLIGGTSRAHTMTAENAKTLADQLRQVLQQPDCGLLITASRRTGIENTKLLRETLDDPRIYFWDGTGENPYFGFLALADTLIVTGDSVSMASEAVATGKPVYIAPLKSGHKRHTAFHKLLRDQGYTRVFTGQLEKWSYTPPDDTMKVAAEIRNRLQKRRAA